LLTKDHIRQVGQGYLGGNIFKKDENEFDIMTFNYPDFTKMLN